MIWNHISQRILQEKLEELHPGLLTRLETLIPAVTSEPLDPTQLYAKKQLIKILNAFLDGKKIRDASFLNSCLEFVPPNELGNLAEALHIDHADATFSDKKEAIVTRIKGSKKGLGVFLEFFDLPDHYMPRSADKLPSSLFFDPPTSEHPTPVHSAFKILKDYQSGVFFECKKRLNIPRTRFMVQMPTGSGKTRTSMEIITSALNDEPKGSIVVWLAHSEELCEQAFLCFCETWEHVVRTRLKASRAWAEHGFPLDGGDDSMFVVAGFQKLARLVKNDPNVFAHLHSRIKLVVVDEAHRTTAPTFKAVAEALMGPETKLIGLSATPGRTDEEESRELAQFYFSTQVGLPDPEGMGVIGMLRDRKVLAEVDYKELKTNRDFKLTGMEKRKLEEELDFPSGFLQRVGTDDIRNIEILKRLINECENKRRILFFACDIAHSKFITALLLYFGYSAGHLDGTTDKSTRRQMIEDFREDRLQVLSNVGILSTGFDAPNTDVVFISRPTNSVVLYSQMIGRGLRGPAIGGTPSCRVIDVRDNIQGYGDADRVYEYFDEYFHG
ncbi:DEAD/DEAH box helicase [Akkermansiaceae bacterium]|nr:DEAD/DEAH box helicase [Akkermansiaceae bacterium]